MQDFKPYKRINFSTTPLMCLFNHTIRFLRLFIDLIEFVVIDASAKIGAGLLVGNIHQVGNFDECLAIQEDTDDRKITGQYCSILISPRKISNKSTEVDTLYDPLKVSDDMFG